MPLEDGELSAAASIACTEDDPIARARYRVSARPDRRLGPGYGPVPRPRAVASPGGPAELPPGLGYRQNFRGRIKAGDVLSSEAVLRFYLFTGMRRMGGGGGGGMNAGLRDATSVELMTFLLYTHEGQLIDELQEVSRAIDMPAPVLSAWQTVVGFPPKYGTRQEWAKKVERLRAYHIARLRRPGHSSGHVPKPECSPKRAASIAVKSTCPRKP